MFSWLTTLRHKTPTPWSSDYVELVGKSRDPRLYQDCAVPDTIDGRFDALALMVSLATYTAVCNAQRRKARILQESFVAHLDDSFRKQGLSDLKVGKRVGAAFNAYNGRQHAYAEALDRFRRDHCVTDLHDALRRNIYRCSDPSPEAVARLAAMMTDYISAELTSERLFFSQERSAPHAEAESETVAASVSEAASVASSASDS